MAAAAVYGVLQLTLLASPTRSLKLSTVLLTVAVGMYGSGVVAALIEYAYAHALVTQPGQSLRDAMGDGSYTVVPIVEELAKLAPLLLAGINLKIRSQLGLADFVVLGAATGAGLGLFEVLLGHMLDAQRAFPLHSSDGWMLSGGFSLTSTYIPGPGTVLGTWLPASLGVLDMSFTQPSLSTNLHLAWGATGAFGVGLLLRGRGPRRALGLVPLAYAIGHHALVNYGGQRGAHTEDWADSLLKGADGAVGWAPLACLVIAMAIDYAHIRRGKRAMPTVLLEAERAGRTGLTALTGFGMWCVPRTALIALRFARLRRSLLYAAGRVPPERIDVLYKAVTDTVSRMDAVEREGTRDAARIRARLKSARPPHPWRRRWPLLVIPLILMLPSLVFLGVGSFTATKNLQRHFTTGNGPRVLLWFGVAALVWTLIQLALLLRAWRTTRKQSLAEALALVRLRLWAATGAALFGGLLLISHFHADVPLDGRPTDALAMLLAALENLELYAGIALTMLSLAALIMLFPPGGLALVTGGVLVGEAASVAAVQAGALGVAGLALMGQGATGGPHGSGQDSNAWPRSKRKGRTKPQHRADVKGDEGKNGSHTIDRHVDKTIDGMRNRLRENPRLKADSRYVDEGAAQHFTDETLAVPRNQRKISDWLDRGAKGRLELDAEFSDPTGLHLTRYNFTHGEPTSWVHRTQVVLKGDPSSPSGYRVLTSYPQP
ncbi:RNase A-like domain-containing protein [Streptomyces sp. NPDC054837]